MSDAQFVLAGASGSLNPPITSPSKAPMDKRRKNALALAHQGFRIIPLRRGSKEPYLSEKWKAIMTTDPTRIKEWFRDRPDMNYGVVCDPFHVILDPDEGANKQGRKKEGIKNFLRAEDEALGFVEDSIFNNTLRVRSPKGGVHLYFACEHAYANSASTILPDVDVRGPDGYVVGPGCWTADDPARNTVEGTYEIETDCDIAVLPDWLKKLLDQGGLVGTRAKNAGTLAGPVDMSSSIESACCILRERKPALEGETGDHHTLMTAMVLKDYGISQDKCLELMYGKILFPPNDDHPEGCTWNQMCEPSWDFDDLKTKVENAYRYGNRQIGSKMDLLSAVGEEVSPPPVDGMDAAQAKLAPGEHYSAISQPIGISENRQRIKNAIFEPDAFLNRAIEFDALFPEWVPARGVTAILATRGTGKSIFMEDMCLRIATDTPWNGIKPAEDWACVYLCGEDDGGLQRNFAAWKKLHGKYAGPERLLVADAVPNLMSEQDVRDWAEELKARFQGRRVVVFIDTWQRATSNSSQNDDKEMQKAIHQAEALAKYLNGCAIIAFHPPKGRDDTITGSMVIENATTCILEMTGGKGEKKIEVKRIKGPGEGNYVKFRIQVVSLEKCDKSGNALTGAIPDFLGGAGMDPMQREIEEKNRKGAWLSILAPLVRIEIGENGAKPLSVTAFIKRAKEKGMTLGDAAFPSKDVARPLLKELFKKPYTFEDGWTLSLLARHTQLEEFCLSSPGVAEAPG